MPAGEAHTITPGQRKITVTVTLDWGDNDLRSDWAGERSFCSFKCLADWASVMAASHDEHVLTEGDPPDG